jgi:thiamine-phosphate pyrophosphorylase
VGCPRNRLTLCLITDRRRLLAVTGLPSHAWADALLAQIEGAVAGGIDVVQIRESGLPAGEYVRFVRRCVEVAGRSRVRVMVNDRLDVALAAGAHGVHLRENSMTIGEARQLSPPGFLVGRSVHARATAAQSRPADYLLAGSVFETDSKPQQPATLGLAGLREVVVAAGACPVWALGGITAERVRDVLACGVSGVAAIGAFLPRDRTTAVTEDVRKASEALRFSLTG